METPKPGSVVRVNSTGDLMFDADAKPHIGKIGEVVRQQKNGLFEVQTSEGLISLPRRNLHLLKMSSFSSLPTINSKPITGPVQVYEDNWPDNIGNG